MRSISEVRERGAPVIEPPKLLPRGFLVAYLAVTAGIGVITNSATHRFRQTIPPWKCHACAAQNAPPAPQEFEEVPDGNLIGRTVEFRAARPDDPERRIRTTIMPTHAGDDLQWRIGKRTFRITDTVIFTNERATKHVHGMDKKGEEIHISAMAGTASIDAAECARVVSMLADAPEETREIGIPVRYRILPDGEEMTYIVTFAREDDRPAPEALAHDTGKRR